MRIITGVIKAFAIALAAMIILALFTGVCTGFSVMGWIFGEDAGSSQNWTSEDYKKDVTELEISVKATSLKIRQSKDEETVRVETNNEYVSSWTDQNGLHVIEKSHGVFGLGGTGEVVIYVREGYVFDEVEVSVGAGTLEVANLETKKLKLDLGAGKSEIRKLKVYDEVKIDGGAGSLSIENGEAKDARISIGAGKADLKLKLEGENKIECGVGKLDLELLWQKDGYRLEIDKGLGSVKLDGQNMSDGDRMGDGKVRVDIKSGVGAVDIKLGEKK